MSIHFEVLLQVPQEELLSYLKALKPSSVQLSGDNQSRIGIGLDSCLIPTRHKGISLIETTDFFYPLINDPYLMVCNFYICLFFSRPTSFLQKSS